MKLTAAEQHRLGREPWLEAFIEPGDVTLDQADKRYRDATRAAWAELRAQHRDVYKRMKVRGLETTALQLGQADR
jgi:hypothetical protein